jgi:hypothetical protein
MKLRKEGKKFPLSQQQKEKLKQFLKHFHPVESPVKKDRLKKISLKMFKYEYMRHSEAVFVFDFSMIAVEACG